MKKTLVLVSAVLLLAGITTSCSKTGCHCYFKTDITHVAPVFEDENMSKEDCKAKEAELNEEEGVNIIQCK